MTGRQTKWTEEEDKFLLEMVRDGVTSKRIAELLGRTYYSVTHRRATLVKAKGYRASQGWEPHEVNYLLTNAGNMPRRKIAEHLGRTVGAVGNKLHHMGVCSRQGKHTVRGIAKKIGVSKAFLLDARDRMGARWGRRDGPLATNRDVVKLARWMLDPKNDVRVNVTAAHLRRIIEEYDD